MSVIPSGSDLGLVGLASEYKRAGDVNNSNIDKSDRNTVIENKLNKSDTSQLALQQSSQESLATQPLTTEQLDKVAQQLQDFVGDLNRNIQFSVDKDSGRDVIKVIDKDSGDLLKQYPSEEVLTLVSKLSDMVGGFIDAKV